MFAVSREVVRDRRALLLSTEETLDGNPRLPLPLSCPGRVELQNVPPLRVRPRAPIGLHVVITNDSDVLWPASGVIPKNLVRARVCFESAARTTCQKPLRLRHDLPAGDSVPLYIQVRAPQWPGSYELRIELFQAGNLPLEQCGVEPVRWPIKVSGLARRRGA